MNDRRILLGIPDNPGCLLEGQGLDYECKPSGLIARLNTKARGQCSPYRVIELKSRAKDMGKSIQDSFQINGSIVVAAGQPLETVLMWPRRLASNSSHIGVIGERLPLKPGVPQPPSPVSGIPNRDFAHPEQSPASDHHLLPILFTDR